MKALEATLIPFFILKNALTGLGGYLAYKDYRDREVLLWPALIFLTFLLPFWKGDNFVIAAMLMPPLIFSLYKKWLAFVDFCLLLGSIFIFTPSNIALLCLCAGVLLLCTHLIRKEKRIPFLSIYIPLFILALWIGE